MKKNNYFFYRFKEETMLQWKKSALNLIVVGLLLVWGMIFPLPGWANCPPGEKLQKGIKKIFPKLQFEMGKTGPSEMPGICQTQIKVGNQIYVLYSDQRGDYLFSGNLFEIKNGRNLTMETQQAANRLSPEDMQTLETLSPFAIGNGKKVLYLVTDPQCPYCKQAETLLKKWTADLQIRFILLPLDIHKGAKEQCISIICDNKGIEGFDAAYQSNNQCPEGTKKVENSIAFLQKKGISSTPTFIFSDGIFISGLPPEEELRKRLALP
jgi:thiol:disulfide interchange protein DsbC